MRLLSFLNDIESALIKQAAENNVSSWSVSRMVNYHQNLARMLLAPLPGAPTNPDGGAVLLQSFLLADGSLCVKATLSWEGSPLQPVMSVYAKPQVDWTAEAARVAAVWFAGPTPEATDAPSEAASIS